MSWHWRVMQNLKKTRYVISKMTRIWWILIRAPRSLESMHFNWSLSCKVNNVWPKKVQRSYLSWHWRVMKNLKKNWLLVWKMTWGIWQIFTRTLEIIKIDTFMGLFCPKEKVHEKLCVMAPKNDEKSEEALTCHFKTDIRNLTSFDSGTWKSQKFTL